MKKIRWRGLEGGSSEYLAFQALADGFAAEGVHVDDEFGITFRVEIDARWRFRSLTLVMVGEGRWLTLERDGDGNWFRGGQGEPLHFLEAAQEIDLSVTPFTNTLPIRRLGLAVGESAEIMTAYVDFPSLEVTADPQRYTRLSEFVYRFESIDSDFQADITVDEDGFVVDYPGLFMREKIS